jgi:hypothetical protein
MAPPPPAVSVAASPEVEADGEGLAFVLGPDGSVHSWRAGDASLGPLPAALARLNSRPINDLEVSGDGATMVALPSSPPGARVGRVRHEGSAVVVSMPPAPGRPSVRREIAFDGDGRLVAVSTDGRRAYVLATRAVPDASPGQTRIWLHALDLDAGRVESSAQIDRPPAAMTLDPAATRLYLAYDGRIVSYTTHPFARSWHYRSPGANLGVYSRPRSAVLFAAREKQVALFDPAVIGAMKPEERQKREDDATTLISLPFTADSLLFSRDRRLAAAHGPANSVVFFDPESGRVFGMTDGAALDPRQEARPFEIDPGQGDLVVAVFPDAQVRVVHPPAAALEPEVRIPQTAPVPTPSASPIPEPSPAATPPTPEAPAPDVTPPPALSGLTVLAGRVRGRFEAVRSIVVYGPGSIVREQARATPDADGSWRVPLPPPGLYRIVPLGEGSQPLRSDPNFHTVEVRDLGRNDLDFSVLGTY